MYYLETKTGLEFPPNLFRVFRRINGMIAYSQHSVNGNAAIQAVYMSW